MCNCNNSNFSGCAPCAAAAAARVSSFTGGKEEQALAMKLVTEYLMCAKDKVGTKEEVKARAVEKYVSMMLHFSSNGWKLSLENVLKYKRTVMLGCEEEVTPDKRMSHISRLVTGMVLLISATFGLMYFNSKS